MDHRQAGRYWDGNADAWTLLSRQGWDTYRDVVNTPAFLSLLPDIAGQKGIDIGCGEGHNTRLLVERGADMYGVDISPAFVYLAAEMERANHKPIRYVAASAVELPFPDGEFEFATAFMSLMDMPDQALALREIHRVLRAGGFLQFSIMHPCFFPPHRRLLRDPRHSAYAVEVGRYFDRVDGQIDRWLFSAAPDDAKSGLRSFEVPIFHRTLSEWMNGLLEAGFELERVAEPRADEETAKRVPSVADTRVVAYFLHVRCTKPITRGSAFVSPGIRTRASIET